MNEPIIWGIGGLLIGFILEYLVDLFFWRRKMRKANGRSEQFEGMLRDQHAEIGFVRGQMAAYEKSLDEHEAYIKTIEYELEGARLELGEMRVQHEAAEARARQYQADGATLRKQLQKSQAGSESTDMAEAKRKLARYKRALYDAVNENKQLTKQLRGSEAALVTTNGNGDLTGTVETYKNLDATPAVGDPLEQIGGIGPVYADKLRAAGIRTFTDLARMRAERLTDIIKPNRWQQIEPDRWITEAADLASGGGSIA